MPPYQGGIFFGLVYPTKVGSVARADFDYIIFFDEQGNLNRNPEDMVTGFRTLPAVSPRKASGASVTVASTEAGNSSLIALSSTK